MNSDATSARARRVPLWRLLITFLSFGLVGFGGPAAHLALMEREIVTRHGWLSREHFLSLLAAVNLVPGPNSTEMAFHIGQVVGGLRGMVLAGLGFIVPAVILSTGLAMLYVSAGSVPAIQGVLLGVKPVILVLILSAAYRLGRSALHNTPLRLIFAGAMLIVLFTLRPVMAALGWDVLHIHELAILLACGLMYVAYIGIRRRLQVSAMAFFWLPLGGLALNLAETLRPALVDLFGRFLVIGGTLFGSGYVLAAYMERSFVQETGWLTARQLLDTLAIGQATPGPVLSTAAAAGYVMTVTPGALWSGVPGALVSAVAVFLPAFFIVLALGQIVPRLQRIPLALDFLAGVNAGVIALLIGAFISLAASTLVQSPAPPGALPVDWLSVLLAGFGLLALERWGWTPSTLIILGAGLGVLRTLLA